MIGTESQDLPKKKEGPKPPTLTTIRSFFPEEIHYFFDEQMRFTSPSLAKYIQIHTVETRLIRQINLVHPENKDKPQKSQALNYTEEIDVNYEGEE